MPWLYVFVTFTIMVMTTLPIDSSIDSILSLFAAIAVVVTLVGATRHVIGVPILGIFTTLFLVFGYLSLGLPLATIILVVSILLAGVGVPLMRHFPILFIPRSAAMMSAILLAVGLVLLGLARLGEEVHLTSALALIAFLFVVNNFISLYLRSGIRYSLWRLGGSVLVAVLSLLIFRSTVFWSLLTNYHLGVLSLALIVNILLGRWTGLRLNEYLRFKKLIIKP